MSDKGTHGNHEARIKEVLYSVFSGDNEAVIQHIIEVVGGVEVLDVQYHNDGSFEVWIGQPGSFTGDELSDIEVLFDVEEIGVYGDPELAGTEEDNGLEGTFYARVTPHATAE